MRFFALSTQGPGVLVGQGVEDEVLYALLLVREYCLDKGWRLIYFALNSPGQLGVGWQVQMSAVCRLKCFALH